MKTKFNYIHIFCEIKRIQRLPFAPYKVDILTQESPSQLASEFVLTVFSTDKSESKFHTLDTGDYIWIRATMNKVIDKFNQPYYEFHVEDVVALEKPNTLSEASNKTLKELTN